MHASHSILFVCVCCSPFTCVAYPFKCDSGPSHISQTHRIKSMSLERAAVNIRLKLRFHNLPFATKDDEVRTFMQYLEHVEMGFCDMQMVASTVDSKLVQLGVPHLDYRVLHRIVDAATGSEELVEVDDGYWGMLMRDVVSGGGGSQEPLIELMIRVGRAAPTSPAAAVSNVSEFANRSYSDGHLPHTAAVTALTRDALHTAALQAPALATSSPDMALRVMDLLEQPPYSQFHVVGVIAEIRLKRHPILEADLCDEHDPTARITLVCFDEHITNHLRRTLRGNLTERVEVRGVSVVRKSGRDIQYQSNHHPMLLRVAPQSFSMRVVGYIAGGLALHNTGAAHPDLAPPQVVEIAPRRAVAALGSSAPHSSAPTTTFLSLKTLRPSTPSSNGASGSNASVGSGGSGGSQSGRTMLNLMGAVQRPGMGSSTSSSSAVAAVAPYQEQGVPQVGTVDVHQRDDNIDRSERKIEALKNRIHAATKQRPSTRCILCHVDVEAPQESMEMVKEMLTKSRANRGKYIPQFPELLQALADRRSLYTSTNTTSSIAPGGGSGGVGNISRYYCKARFVDLLSGTCHLVHPRCAHICEAYQRGQVTIEDIPLHMGSRVCCLCQGAGATVKCYHPECKEEFHVVCALFSHGYVNFGKRDPLLPVPACPKHTQVKCPTLMCRDENATAADRKRRRDDELSDQVLFDSSVVERGDLRDPDEELDDN